MIKWEIRTRDTLNAGTDARVYLVLRGDRGVLPEAELIDSDSYNNWERGDVNGGTLQTSAEIGNITSGTLRQDGSGIGPDWQVESVKITSQGVDFIAPVYAELKRNKPVQLALLSSDAGAVRRSTGGSKHEPTGAKPRGLSRAS
jgi:hypothetical protein